MFNILLLLFTLLFILINLDINASICIRDEGLRILTSGTGDKAYRQTVRRSNRERKKSTTALVSG